MFQNKDFTILIPSYKNLKTLRLLLAEVSFLKPGEIVVIDCNSKENLKNVTKKYENVTLLNFPKKNAKHKALEVGFSYCMNLDTKYILTVDAKKEHSIKEIMDIMSLMSTGKYSLVSGNRKFLKFRDRIKLFFPKIAISLLTDINNRDVFCDLRVYKKNTLRKMMYSKNSFHLSLKVSREMKKEKEKTGFLSYEGEEEKKGKSFKFFLKFCFLFTREKFFKLGRGFKKGFVFLRIFVEKHIKIDKERIKVFFKKTKSFSKKTFYFLKKLIGIPDVKRLKRKEQNLFVFSMLLPLLLAYGVLHLYANPLGYWEKFELESREVEKTMSDFFSKDNIMYLDGITEITISPKTDRANVIVNIRVEGDENLYIIEERIKEEEIKKKIWDFEKETHYLDEYEVKDNSEYLSFKLEVEDDWYREIEKPELVLKYGQIQLIRHQDVFELRRTHYSSVVERVFQEIDKKENLQNIVVVFKQPNKEKEIRGFLALYINEKMEVQPLINQTQGANNISWEWSENFKKDITQKHISLKQEDQIPEQEVENLDEDSCIQKTQEKIYTHTCKIADEFERMYDGKERYVGSKQVIYQKELFSNFNGEVNKISIGYDYPFEKKQEITEHYTRTPISTKIFGEMDEIKKLEITLYKETLW